MARIVHVLPATARHAAEMAPHLRSADRAEVLALTGLDPAAALEQARAASIEAWTGFVDGVPAAMWGLSVLSIAGGEAQPWCLTTALVERVPKQFLRLSRAWVERIAADYAVLRNAVDPRYAKSVRWLEWLGFTLGPVLPIGAGGARVRRFERVRS